MRQFLIAFALLLGLVPSAWPATVTHRVTTADTGNTPNTSGAFTPATDDLLVVFVAATATTDPAPALTSSVGTTFVLTQVNRFNTGDRIFTFVANTMVTNTASQTVTVDTAADVSSGTVIAVFSVAGMSRFGADAVKQDTGQDNQAAAGTPAPVFGANVGTNNPTLGMVANLSNPAALTPPTSWTEASDTGYATPTTGAETVFRDSGFSGTTVTWGGTSATAFGDTMTELDTSPTGCGTTIPLTGAGCK